MSTAGFKVDWLDSKREPKCPPDPRFPNGIDITTGLREGANACKVELPYPAKRCGLYLIECQVCGTKACCTTAGRTDDPRSIMLACNIRWRA